MKSFVRNDNTPLFYFGMGVFGVSRPSVKNGEKSLLKSTGKWGRDFSSDFPVCFCGREQMGSDFIRFKESR